MRWRGLHCDDPDPLFATAPLFRSAAAHRAYLSACEAVGSNPERPHFTHGSSLLTTARQVFESDGVLMSLRRMWRSRLSRAQWEACCEFVANPRDYPLGSCEVPVLSQYSYDDSDVRVPVLEDYQRCFQGCYLGKSARPLDGPVDPPPWESRMSCAVFRGGATGGGVTPETNQRIALAQLSETWRGHPLYGGLLDARLTGWNLRQKLGADGVVRVLDRGAMHAAGVTDVGPQHFMPWAEQAKYKYCVYLDGNVGASRLGAMLSAGFVVLAPPSRGPCTLLWTKMRASVHYVELLSDLSDLGARLVWLRENDDVALRMSRSARALWEAECGREAMENEVARALLAMPPPSEARLGRGLATLWARARSGVYCLVDRAGGRLLMWVAFANEDYEQRLPWRTDPAPLSRFLRHVARTTGERVALPAKRWWTNGALVCNVPHPQVWGEGLLPALRLLVENAALRLRNPSGAWQPSSAPSPRLDGLRALQE